MDPIPPPMKHPKGYATLKHPELTSPRHRPVFDYAFFPYRWGEFIVFDDEQHGLEAEAFVEGMDAIVEKLLANHPERAMEDSCVLLTRNPAFHSPTSLDLWRVRKDRGGMLYHCDELNLEGWCCPNFWLYYRTAPRHLMLKSFPASLILRTFFAGPVPGGTNQGKSEVRGASD